MPRRSAAELELDFERHLRVLEALTQDLAAGLPPDAQPVASARRIRAAVGVAPAIDGIRQATNDLLEALLHASREEVSRVNERLARAGAPRLEQLLAGRARTVRRILKQRRVSTELEYYLVKELLDNLESGLAPDERELFGAMLREYELRVTGTP